MISFYLTVLEDGGKLRMWYICRDKKNEPNVAYAESADGVNWIKPNLGIVEYEGSMENNLVGLSSLEGTVLRDARAPAQERYTYVTHLITEGMVRFHSPDGLHWQRVDGFVSLDFDAAGGRCVTVPVKVDGPRLALNLDTAVLGQLRAGLLDADGKPIAGFGADECAVLRTNSTHALVTWKGSGDLTALEGREVQLTFTGSRAKLYSFRFVTDTP